MKSRTAAATAISIALVRAAVGAEDPASGLAERSFSIHPKLPPFFYQISLESPPNAPMVVRIGIRGGPKGYKPQTLEPWTIREKVIETIDLNFDGYKDIRIVEYVGNRGDEIHACWLYDPGRKTFVPALDLEGIDEVDTQEGTLIDYSSGGVAYWNAAVYRLRNGRPELIREVVTAYAEDVRDVVPASYPDGTVVRITRLYRNGHLARTFYSRRFPEFSQ